MKYLCIYLKYINKRLLYLIMPYVALMFIVNVAVIAQENQPGFCIIDQIRQLELKVFNKNFDNASITDRIDKIEKKVFNKTQPGSFSERLNNIAAKIGINFTAQNKPDNSVVTDNNRVESPETEQNNDQQQPGLLQDGNNKSKNDQKTIEQLPDAAPPPGIANFEPIPDPNQKPKNNKKNKKNKNQPEETPQFDPNAENYYDTLMFVSQEKVIRWKKMPLKIFLPSGNNITYMPEYRRAAIRAFDFWKLKSNGLIDYVLVDNPKKANIIVAWVDNFPESEGDGGQTTSSIGYNDARSLAGTLVQSSGMFMPGYFGYAASLLGAMVGGIGNTAKLKSIQLRIGTLPAMKLKKESAIKLIESITAHEYGHAIGISCHSVNPQDLMFNNMPFDGTLKLPTQRDIATIVELYKHDPDISD